MARRDEADQGRESDEIVKHVGKQALVRRHGCASQLSDKDSIRAIRDSKSGKLFVFIQFFIEIDKVLIQLSVKGVE